MQLKSIEIRGFKSFGDKALIHFNSGVTGIVGPNGCGKSNVVDAMRWVLGEQKTRALRSEKMENIIFNGTSKRKQANLAEVSLVFENNKNVLPTEFTEVKITRRLYRTGESEYQLNGVNCRLKDITNLFLDTGIGSDSYAIIELKMIDDILNDKDGSRRELFEEAAGISKYKARKKETLSKLKDAQTDLDRVEDLLFEIDKNVETLKKQARRTEQFYQLKTEYKSLSLDAAYYTMQGFRDTLDKYIEQEQQQADEKLAITAQIKTTEAAAEQQKLDLINKEKLLISRQKATNEFVNEIRRIEGEQRLKSETLRMLQEREAATTGQIAADNIDLVALKGKNEMLQDNYDAESYTVATAETAMETEKNKRNTAQTAYTDLKTQYDQAQQQLVGAQQKVFALEKNIAVNNIQLETIKNELQRTDSEETNRSKEVREFAHLTTELKDELEAQQNLLDEYIDNETELQHAADRYNADLDDNRRQLADANRSLDANRNELRLIKNLVENMEGYPDALKFLKKNTHIWAQNAQILSDIINCAPQYKLALSAVLEGFLNYFVVQNTAEALHAIRLLGKENKGKANFFILDNYTENTSKKPPIDALVNVVNCDDKYTNLIHYLLKDAILLEDDTEFEQKIQANPTQIYVCLSGKTTGNARRISGGSVGAFEGKKLGQKVILDQLTTDIQAQEALTDQLKAEQQKIHANISTTKNNSKKTIIERCQQKINQLNTEYTKVKTKQEQFESFMRTANNRKTELQQKQTELTELLHQEQAQITEQLGIKTVYENSQNTLQDAYEKAENDFRITSENFNQTNIKYLQLSNKLSGIEREIGYNDMQLTQIRQRTAANQQNLAQIRTDMHAQLSKTDLSDDNLIEMYDQKQNMEAAVLEVEQVFYALRGSIDDADQTTRQLRTKRDNLDEIVQQMKERSGELKLQRASLIERLSVEFDVDTRSFSTYLPQNTQGETAVRKQLTQTKTRIDAFGAINPLAIDAYNEATERHQFITDQRNDLLNAKQSLLQTIAEIDQAATERFNVTFTEVRNNFQRVFRSLFTQDDTCDLILTNPDDILGSDINIIARPKGKRPLTINQLSGGEKTLTATALLFAIYLYKPAPFCIFDEVDAPLDDNNIDKFNNIIKDFSKESQFIIVTHNKRTMSTTDIMYGITMIEQGVSRVVPVDLSALS